MTTLDDLKRAIEAVPNQPPEILPPSYPLDEWQGDWVAYRECQARAWRTAFEWLNTTTCDNLNGDLDEGMALIREKLS